MAKSRKKKFKKCKKPLYRKKCNCRRCGSNDTSLMGCSLNLDWKGCLIYSDLKNRYKKSKNN